MKPIRCILCPTDFSAPAAVAIEHACDLAKTYSAKLVLMHVLPPPAYPLAEVASLPGFPDLLGQLRKRVEADLEALCTCIPAGITFETLLREGVPHEEIVAAARELGCDLLVIATNGRTGWRHALLGSVAERVVRLAHCPVLTVRGQPAERRQS
jgi:glycine betaine transporter